jgi:hypothetical protein
MGKYQTKLEIRLEATEENSREKAQKTQMGREWIIL